MKWYAKGEVGGATGAIFRDLEGSKGGGTADVLRLDWTAEVLRGSSQTFIIQMGFCGNAEGQVTSG